MNKITNFKNTKVFLIAICTLMLLPTLPTFIMNNNETSNTVEQELHTSALTEILRPDGDLTTQWNTPTPHWNRLNEAVINPQPGDTTGILANGDNYNDKIEVFTMTDNTQGPNEVSKIEVQTYGKSFGNTNPKVRIWWNGEWSARQTVNLPRSPMPGPLTAGWATNTWELQGNELDVDNILVEYLSHCTGWFFIPPYFSIPIGSNSIYTSYCEITYKEVSPINPFDIYSPEDIIYTSPMEGYYPASYGFENDPNGAYGTSITFLDEWTGNMGMFLRMYVRDGPYTDHNKVFEIFDSQSGGKTTGAHNFDNPQSSGTIEFWLRMDGAAEVGSTDRYHQIEFRKSDDTIAFRAQLKMLEGGWVSGDRADIEYHDGSDWVEFADCEDESWYHHSITFDCSGDGKFTWRVKAEDGSLVGMISDIPFENSMTTLDEIYFTSIQSHYRGATYWDAFGFDWEPDYYLGANQREGILLSYDSSIPLDWVGLILDDNPIQTLTGDKVLSLYDGGDHVLRLTGEDSSNIYFSDEIHYSCEPEGWHPKTLIGSSSVDIEGQIIDRMFPNDYPARLGYEIQTTANPFKQDPIVSFSVTNTEILDQIRYKVYLNEELVFDELANSIPGVPFIRELTLPELRRRKGHRIIIEITQYIGGSRCKLDYVKISRLECWDIKDITVGQDTNPYTPCQIWGFDDTPDELLVNLETKHGAPNSNGWISASQPGFDTAITVQINPDTPDKDDSGWGIIDEYNYYIDKVFLEMRVMRPDGTYINWPGPVTYDFHVCKAAYDYNPVTYTSMDMLLDSVSFFFAFIDIGDSAWDVLFEIFDDMWVLTESYIDAFGLLDSLVSGSPPGTHEDYVGDEGYVGWWGTGHTPYGPYEWPNPELEEFSMLVGWEPDLGGEPPGPYQIEIIWTAEIWVYNWGYVMGYPFHFIDSLFTKTFSSYINFILF